jgi:alkylhydroperoxidase/carboxymuconolactone decarboxylase family protein YurZ
LKSAQSGVNGGHDRLVAAEQIRVHMNAALNNGLTLDEIEVALVQTLPHVGFPVVATAHAAAVKSSKSAGSIITPAMSSTVGCFDSAEKLDGNV